MIIGIVKVEGNTQSKLFEISRELIDEKQIITGDTVFCEDDKGKINGYLRAIVEMSEDTAKIYAKWHDTEWPLGKISGREDGGNESD